MLANETMTDENGYQVALFPLEGFSISQPWWGTFSHEGGATYYANDLVPYDSNGTRLFRAPCYAPVDIQLLWKDPSEAVALWQSLEPVHFADDTIDYLGIIVYHDNDLENGTYSSVGTIKRQGEIFNRSGTGAYATGDHVHFNTANGTYAGYHHVPPDNQGQLVNSEHIYDICYINDTVLVEDYNYNWQEYHGGHTPTGSIKSKFKWVLYANKIRERNSVKY